MHDVVAHHVSVMVIQAGAARLVAATDPAAADAALQVVERSGRGALTDLRRIMGVMRRSDAPDADTSIGLAHLDQLVDRTRASGVPVDVACPRAGSTRCRPPLTSSPTGWCKRR